MAITRSATGFSRLAFVLTMSGCVFVAVLWLGTKRKNAAVRSADPVLVARPDDAQALPRGRIGIDRAVPAVGSARPAGPGIEHEATSREDLSSILRAEPYFERGALVGLRLLPGMRASQLSRLDLQPGDIVRTIDGSPIRSADAAWNAIDDAISLRARITLGVERKGVVLPMTLDGARLAQPPLP